MTNKVLVNFIQDRSGSMGTVWPETLNGFKAFVEELQKKGTEDSVEYLFSLTTFDTVVDCPFIAEPIVNVPPDTLSKHGPRGSTALYDAVGKTIENTAADSRGADKIICVIVTDGQENSSREWSKDALNQVIASKLDAGNWTFTYLGTQPETWDDATSLGIAMDAAAGVDLKKGHAMYTATSRAVHAMAASSDKQSRGLFTSRHASPSAMRGAGMTVKSGNTPRVSAPHIPVRHVPVPHIPPQKRKPTKPTTRRWR